MMREAVSRGHVPGRSESVRGRFGKRILAFHAPSHDLAKLPRVVRDMLGWLEWGMGYTAAVITSTSKGHPT